MAAGRSRTCDQSTPRKNDTDFTSSMPRWDPNLHATTCFYINTPIKSRSGGYRVCYNLQSSGRYNVYTTKHCPRPRANSQVLQGPILGPSKMCYICHKARSWDHLKVYCNMLLEPIIACHTVWSWKHPKVYCVSFVGPNIACYKARSWGLRKYATRYVSGTDYRVLQGAVLGPPKVCYKVPS